MVAGSIPAGCVRLNLLSNRILRRKLKYQAILQKNADSRDSFGFMRTHIGRAPLLRPTCHLNLCAIH